MTLLLLGLLVFKASGTGVLLSWNYEYQQTNELSFRILWGLQPGIYGASQEAGWPITGRDPTNGYQFATLVPYVYPGTTYYFTVVTLNRTGEKSLPSNEAAVAIAVPPPTRLRMLRLSDSVRVDVEFGSMLNTQWNVVSSITVSNVLTNGPQGFYRAKTIRY